MCFFTASNDKLGERIVPVSRVGSLTFEEQAASSWQQFRPRLRWGQYKWRVRSPFVVLSASEVTGGGYKEWRSWKNSWFEIPSEIEIKYSFAVSSDTNSMPVLPPPSYSLTPAGVSCNSTQFWHNSTQFWHCLDSTGWAQSHNEIIYGNEGSHFRCRKSRLWPVFLTDWL